MSGPLNMAPKFRYLQKIRKLIDFKSYAILFAEIIEIDSVGYEVK
jgi:hypothetical protein